MYNQKILLVATQWIQLLHTTINKISEEAIQLILHTMIQQCMYCIKDVL